MKPNLKGNARRSLSDEILARISGQTQARTTNLGPVQWSPVNTPDPLPHKCHVGPRGQNPCSSINKPVKPIAEVGDLRRKKRVSPLGPHPESECMLSFRLETRQITILNGAELLGHVSMSSVKAPTVVAMFGFLCLFHYFILDVSLHFPLFIYAW